MSDNDQLNDAPNDDTALDEETAMELRTWYASAAPAPDAREFAIRRVMNAGTVGARMPRAARSRGWLVGLAVAASLLLAATATWRTIRYGVGRSPAGSVVAFEVRLPQRVVRAVALTGDFNGWSQTAMPMRRDGTSDRWQISVTLPPGRHVYSFVVDGKEWVINPLAPRAELDDFGPANVIAISGEGN